MVSLPEHFSPAVIAFMLVLVCAFGQETDMSPDELQRLSKDKEHFAARPCTPYVAPECDRTSSADFDAEACDRASRSFYSGNRAGLYAVSSNGGWKQVTDYKGMLANGTNTLSLLGTEYFNPVFTKLIVYSHGRDMKLHRAAAHNRFMDDGFCRLLDGETTAVDYAKLFREQGFNVLVWYWAQYSWSPAKPSLAGDIYESGSWWWSKAYNIGTEVSPKIWADDYIRRNGKGMQPEDYRKWATPAGNPLWANFSNASLCLGKESWDCKLQYDHVFEWTETKTDKDEFDPSLAIGNVFAESLLAIAPSLSSVTTFHLVGNSYGSQVVLHGTYLVLEKLGLVPLQSCSNRTQNSSIASVPVPTRLVLVDPVYKMGSVRCGVKRMCLMSNPILDLAVKQLKVIHDYGVPTLKLDATGLANMAPGTLNTNVLAHNAATVHIKMFVDNFFQTFPFNTAMHTQSVDWYFRTYFEKFSSAEEAGNSSACPPAETEPIIFGCTADSNATASFDRMVGDEAGIVHLGQATVNANPWKAEWVKGYVCRTHWIMNFFSMDSNVKSIAEARRAGRHKRGSSTRIDVEEHLI